MSIVYLVYANDSHDSYSVAGFSKENMANEFLLQKEEEYFDLGISLEIKPFIVDDRVQRKELLTATVYRREDDEEISILGYDIFDKFPSRPKVVANSYRDKVDIHIEIADLGVERGEQLIAEYAGKIKRLRLQGKTTEEIVKLINGESAGE